MAAKTKRMTFALVGVLVAAGAAWGVTELTRRPAKAEELPGGISLARLDEASRTNPREAMDTIRKTMEREDLSDEERKKLGEGMRELFEKRMQEHVDEWYDAKDDEEKEKILDKHIDEFEQWRKEMEAREQEREAQDDGKTEEEKEKERDARRDRWRKMWSERSQQERKAHSEGRNPNETAKRMAYWSAMRKQMTARGIQPRGGGPGGRGGRGGRR